MWAHAASKLRGRRCDGARATRSIGGIAEMVGTAAAATACGLRRRHSLRGELRAGLVLPGDPDVDTTAAAARRRALRCTTPGVHRCSQCLNERQTSRIMPTTAALDHGSAPQPRRRPAAVAAARARSCSCPVVASSSCAATCTPTRLLRPSLLLHGWTASSDLQFLGVVRSARRRVLVRRNRPSRARTRDAERWTRSNSTTSPTTQPPWCANSASLGDRTRLLDGRPDLASRSPAPPGSRVRADRAGNSARMGAQRYANVSCGGCSRSWVSRCVPGRNRSCSARGPTSCLDEGSPFGRTVDGSSQRRCATSRG